ncbi:hypothetical protein R1flu_021987 [Riccia fluitans]|uniref:F-box domain-containing protein n=1 Tax=Riccia fluitans TaxID=41844 RepID=A0ABD1ZTV6_9MARC
MDMASPDRSRSMEDFLPKDLLGEIFSHLVDARDLSRVAMVNSSFRKQCRYAENVRFNCQLKNILDKSKRDHGEAQLRTPFKQTVVTMMKTFECMTTLRLEIEEDVQAKRFKEDEVDKTSLWLSEGQFVRSWLPGVSETLTSLTIIDYGHQAIYHPSPLLQLVSQNCKQMERMELRNMFLDLKGCSTLARMKLLKLKCVKLMDNGLQEINEVMPMLEHIVLELVVGLRQAKLKSDMVKILCLTCITRVSVIKLESNSLKGLQLKVNNPDEVRVRAPNLEILTIRMARRPESILEFNRMPKLKELLLGANEMSVLEKVSTRNKSLQEVYLDIPCMLYDEHGSWRGVKRDSLPASASIWKSLKNCCRELNSLSVGPGFWFGLEERIRERIGEMQHPADEDSSAMEVEGNRQQLVQVAVKEQVTQPWSSMKRLTLHLVIQEAELSFGLLSTLLQGLPYLEKLDLYVHKDSKVEIQTLRSRLWEIFPRLSVTCESWSKHLKFDGFTQLETHK